jgi:hypothetical protein
VDLFLCWEKDAWVFLQAVQNSCNNYQLLDEVEQNVGGEQINYLPMPKASEFNNCLSFTYKAFYLSFNISSPSLFLASA